MLNWTLTAEYSGEKW